ncbi:response regulator [Vallitalea pronyensis]|uniref:Stage 0 sporulation protein A homolog n=1 Tax=Vallitalea pronyensis TaxID=1348613 RepID=A0A8J8MNI8_9FIRM|nr:response regulator [Vallitalea pronyensis]QUI24711.1 response regulator [Vallitalea pronyensis]
MFSVLIVDDELYIRKGLMNIINWKKFQCEICGEACDGVEGLEKIKALKPDIVFVDINMPEIDGLSMIGQVKDECPHTKFILLTGYRDFSYLQEAIKLGAFDYLLKPSKIEEICEVVKRAVLELKYQSDEEKELIKIKESYENSKPILRQKLLYDIIFNITTNYDENEQELHMYGIEIHKFIMMVVEIDEELEDYEPYQRQLYQFGLTNTIEEMFQGEFKVEKIAINSRRLAFIIQTQDERLSIENIHKKVSNIQQLVKNCFNFSITASISKIGEGIQALPEKMKECEEGLSYKFYLGENAIIIYEDLASFYKPKDDSLLEAYKNNLIRAIKTGNNKHVGAVLQEIKVKVFEEKKCDPEMIKTFCWNVIYAINNIRLSIKAIEDNNKSVVKDISSLYRLIEQSKSIDELHCLLVDAAHNVVSRINRYNKDNIHSMLNKATQYIQDNYHRSITLNDLAEYTYVSTYYISRIFKKEIGKNFVDYLNEIRINKAKELLNNKDYKTYEVAEQVGIQDPHYFSKLFKKYTNMTPTDYRTQKP